MHHISLTFHTHILGNMADCTTIKEAYTVFMYAGMHASLADYYYNIIDGLK